MSDKLDGLNVCLMNDSFPPVIDGVATTILNYAEIINNGLGKASGFKSLFLSSAALSSELLFLNKLNILITFFSF